MKRAGAVALFSLLVLAAILGVATARPCHAAAGAPEDWVAPWDTLSGPLDVPNFQYARAVHDPMRHRMLVWAGVNPGQMWTLSLPATGTPEWTQVDIEGPLPPPRQQFAAVYDSLRDRMLVFGGFGSDSSYVDVWALSLAGEPRWSQVVTLGTPPPAGRIYTVIHDTRRDRLVVFGGQADFTLQISDLWELTLSDPPTWSPITPLYHPPWPRLSSSAVYDPWNDRMILFGGWQDVPEPWSPDGGYLYNDTYALNFGDTPYWWPLTMAVNPPGRLLATAVVDPRGRRMIMAGGAAATCSVCLTPLHDTWAFQLDGGTGWSQILPAEAAAAGVGSIVPLPAMPTVVGYGGVYSPERNSLVVFSGNWAQCFELSLDSAAWAQILPPIPDSFPPRQPHGTLRVERDTGRLLMLGAGGALDAWSFGIADTTGWRLEAMTGYGPASGPRTNAYDSKRNRLISFDGGNVPSRGDFLDQVWALPLDPPRVWSQLPVSGPVPPGRSNYAALYDPMRDRVLLFGGEYGENRTSRMYYGLDEVWSLSLADMTWTELHPTGGPSPRAEAWAVYDSLRDRMLIVGGCTPGYAFCGPLRDTWALSLRGDSLTWGELNDQAPEVGYSVLGPVVLDPLRDRLLLTGPSMTTWGLPLDDPSAWRQVAVPGRLPLPRLGPAAFFDTTRDEVFLFGGSDRADLYGLRFSAADVRLVSAQRDSDHVTLTWGGVDPGEPMCVQRSKGDGAWTTLATLTADAAGRIGYVDWDLAAGARYGYRPAVPGANRHYAETWLDVPAGPAFALRGAVPNPARQGLTVAFTLAYGSRGRLDLFDLAGRRVLARDLGDLAPGPHMLALESGALRPGVYLLRLQQGGRSATARAVVLK